MEDNLNVICFSTIDWDFIWQGHQQIMSSFAKEGHNVLFVENMGVRSPKIKDAYRIVKRFKSWRASIKGVHRLTDRLFLFSPFVFPFPYSKICTGLNVKLTLNVIRKWIESMEKRRVLIWIFLPTPIVERLILEIESSCIVYYCIDDLIQSSKGAQKIVYSEKNIIKKADLVFVTAHHLKDKCLKLRKEVHLFPFGYDEELYASIRVDENLKPPVEFNNIPHPRAVYLGGLHKHVDQDLILKCAEKFPNVSFILIGPRQESFDAMESFSNIYMLGKKLKEEVPSYLKFCDIALIPYVRSHYTDCVYPTKMNEYLAMNLPIISTDIPEVVRYQSETGAPIQTAASHQSFVQCLGDLVKKIDKKEIRGIEHAHKQSWSYKISKMQELIQHVLDDKLNSNMAPWQQRFKKMFIKKKLQFYYGITGLLMGYLILFHTPLMWFVAQPLFFQSQNLIPSDVAVVLGGGVGETGEVAQGYQERVAMGVQLYHDQLASHLIFASGYRYEFYEAYVMKQLAMSQGVPENKILIESDGSNTYETLKRVSKLIQDNLMKTVIIVSSPYHLRRAQLVAHKIFPKNLSVSFKPLDKSYFFGSLNSKPKWIQMKAIAHEYIAILYYRLKSYI